MARNDMILGMGLDTSGAIQEAKRLADLMRRDLGGAGDGAAASSDSLARSLRDAASAASAAQRALGGIDGTGGIGAAAHASDELSDALRRTGNQADQANSNVQGLTASAKELAIGLAAGIGAALAGGALAAWVSETAHAADELARLSDQSGISVEKLSAWGNVAQRNGQDVNDLAELTTEMSLRLAEIDNSSEGAGLALKQLGLDYKSLAAMPAEQAFETIAQSVAGTENSGRKTALVMAALGDEAQKYITTLNTIGSAGQMEAIVTAQQAAAAREYVDAMNGVHAAGAAWSQSIVSGILPALSEAARAIDDVISGTDGMTQGARTLASDGSITDWARGGVTALTYLIDVGVYVGKLLSSIAKTAAAAAVQVVQAMSGIGDVAGKVLVGDFSGAATAATAAIGRVKGAGQAWADDMGDTWSERTLGAKIRDRIADTKAYSAAAREASKPSKPSVSGKSLVKTEAPGAKSGGGIDGAAALVRAQAQAELAAEMDATNSLRKALERRKSMGLEESGDYYLQLADLAARESKAKLAAIDADAAAERARAAKDPANAKQSEAKLLDLATKRAQEVSAAREKAADIAAAAEKDALDKSRETAKQWAQSWQDADKLTQQYAGASAKAQAAMIVDPLERARAEAEIAAQQIATDSAAMVQSLNTQIDQLNAAGSTGMADALKAKLDELRAGIAAEQDRTRTAPDSAFVADYLGKATPGQKIAEGFDAASQSLSAFVTGFQSLFKVEEDYGKAMSARGLTAEKIAEIEQAHQAQQVNAYGTLAGAAKGFFGKQTAGYRVLATAEKAFRAYELAMSIKNAAVKMGLLGTETAAKVAAVATEAGAVVAGQGVETGAVVAGEAARNAAKVPGVFMAFMSSLGPFGMAAAGVAIAAVLGGAFGGGGGSAPSAADRQASNGTGTVLGDDAAKSASISNSIDLLRDVDTLTMQYSAKMLESLRGIEAAMAGVSTQILRAGGVTTGKNMGISVGTSSAGDAVGALLSKIPLIGGILGGVVGSVLGGLFGKSSTSITDAGLSISGTAAQMQQGQGVNQYADATTTKKSWFSSSTKTSTVLQDAGDDVSRQFGLIFGGVSDSLQAAAGAMGQDSAAVARTLAGYVIDIPRLSLQGLSGADLQEAISTAVGAKADDMAKLIAPGLVQFQRVGEGYFESVVRVASATESAGATLRRLGVASVGLGQVVNKQAEDIGAEIVRQSITTLEGLGTGIGSIIGAMEGSASELADTYTALRDVRDSLVMMGLSGSAVSRSMLAGAGSLEALSSGVSAFEKGFFSESEQTEMATARMAAEFRRLGVAMPESREGFRALVTGIDTSTDAGQQLVGSLLPLSSAFAELMSSSGGVADAIQSITDAQRDQITTTLAQLGIGRGADVGAAVGGAGGVDALTSGLSSFESKFLTDSERFSLQSERMAAQFNALGVAMPTSAAGFKSLVSGVDATSEAGSTLLGGLLPLSSGFADLIGSMEQLQTTTSNLGKGIESEISRIRGAMGQQAGQTIGGAQAAFAIATAQARAGDATALEALPGLSQALLKTAEEQSATREDLVRLQAQTAASLQTTLDTARGTLPAAASASEITTPTTVLNAAPVSTALAGVTAADGTSAPAVSGSAALLVELQAMRAEATVLRNELMAMRQESLSGLTTVAANTARSARILDRVTAGGDTVQTQVVTA